MELEAGLSVFPNLCSQSAGKGMAPVKCEFYNQCAYIAQFDPYSDVFIYTHAHLSLERSQLETWQPHTVIIDEAFFQSCFDQVRLPITLLTHPCLPLDAQVLCQDIAAAFQTGQPLCQRILDSQVSCGDYTKAVRAIEQTRTILSPVMTDAQQETSLKQNPNFAPVLVLLAHLAAEFNLRKNLQSTDYDHTTGEIAVYRRRPIIRFNRRDGAQPKIIILDASASRIIAGQFFEIDAFDVIETKRNAYTIQCDSTRCSTTSLVAGRNTHEKSKAEARQKLADIQALIDKQCANNRQVLVVGPSAIAGNPRAGIAPLITVAGHCELTHFNALRGIDRWKDFEVIIIIGRNEPPIKEIENIARGLFFDHPDPLILPGNWGYEVRGYRAKGNLRGVEVAVHRDPRVQAIVEQLREQESVQAIDRLRLIYCPQMKTVIVLSNIPLDIDVDELRSWNEVINGSRLEQAWNASDGVLPLNPTWLSARYPELWKTEAAAKKDVRGMRRKGHFSNNNSIRIKTPFDYLYKGAAARRWSRCLSRFSDQRRIARALKKLTRETVVVKRVI